MLCSAASCRLLRKNGMTWRIQYPEKSSIYEDGLGSATIFSLLSSFVMVKNIFYSEKRRVYCSPTVA